MSCTTYIAGAAPAVTAPVTSISAIKIGSNADGELVDVIITTGAGTGAQPAINITVKVGAGGTNIIDSPARPINGSYTLHTSVGYGNTVVFCAT